MLKFKDDYTTLTATFEDFILLVYTVIDEFVSTVCPCMRFPKAECAYCKDV